MDIKNEALKKMLASAAAIKKKEMEEQKKEETRIATVTVESLPTVSEDVSSFSFSLDAATPITKQQLIENTKVGARQMKGETEQYNKAKRKVGRLTTGSAAAVPLVCKGSGCPFRVKCPYFEENIHEVGEDCLVEAQLIEFWTYKYIEELDIDTSSISEMHTLSSLIELAIMDLRMSNYIAINDQDLMMDFIASVDPNGIPLTNKGASIAFDVKERIDKRRLKILETFNNTREKKAKLVLDSKEAEKSASRNIMDKLDALASKIAKEKASTPKYEDAEVIEIKW